MNRRRLLRGGASALTVTVAGCLGGDGTLVRSPTGTSEYSVTATTRDSPGSSGTVVEMTDNLVFLPETVEVTSGETVTWTNVGTYSHTVTAYEAEIPEGGEYFASGGYESERDARVASGGSIGAGESYAHTFEVEGVYEYYCIPHENAGMVGTVEVLSG